jgi:thiosulfate/3-mercaptopyruvate sulfurtransferase
MELLVSTEWLAKEIGASDLRVVDATWFMPDAGRNAAADRRFHGFGRTGG